MEEVHSTPPFKAVVPEPWCPECGNLVRLQDAAMEELKAEVVQLREKIRLQSMDLTKGADAQLKQQAEIYRLAQKRCDRDCPGRAPALLRAAEVKRKPETEADGSGVRKASITWEDWQGLPEGAKWNAYERSQDEVTLLRADLAEYLDDAFRGQAHLGKDGWWDSQSNSSVWLWGEKLVELGLWEKDQTRGLGRRQWYRPIEKAADAEQVQGTSQ